MKQLFLLLLGALLSFSCDSPKDKVTKLVNEHVKLSVENPNQIKNIESLRVDSAFGLDYLTPEECKFIYENSKKVSERILKQTKGFTNFSNSTPALISLIERQMKATNEVRSLLLKTPKKGRFSGYKAKVAYQYTDLQGHESRVMRWYFTDPEGKHILRMLEIPIL